MAPRTPLGDAVEEVTRTQGGTSLVTSYGTEHHDVFLSRIDATARELSRTVVAGPADERAMVSAVAPDGSVATLGYADGGDGWDITLWLGAEDPARRHVWSHPSPGAARGVMEVPTGDGAWMVTGTAERGSAPGQLVVFEVHPVVPAEG